MSARDPWMQALLLALLLAGAAAPAHADSVSIESTGVVFWPGFSAGDVLRVTFDMNEYEPPPEMAALDVLQFRTFLNPIDPIGSYTARLFDKGVLLGTYTAPFDPGRPPTAYFASASSAFTTGNPTIIDFSSFNNQRFDGFVELTIDSGRGNGGRLSEGLVLGQALDASTFINNSFAYPDQNALWEVNPTSTGPIPEPASLLLVGSGIAGALMRRRVQAGTRR